MKPFTKRLALVTGLLFTALICMGIVFIDTTQNYWRVGGSGNGFVQLIVSNKLVMSVSTNTGRIGINVTNANVFSLEIVGLQPATNAVGNGATAASSGGIYVSAGKGGATFAPTTAAGGIGGTLTLNGGPGGDAPLALTNATGGTGGALNYAGGFGGMDFGVGVATNATTGGAGGALTFFGGQGGSPSVASTNVVGGQGGNTTISGGPGGLPTAGWIQRGGAGGSLTLVGGASQNSQRTNVPAPGVVNITGGASGSPSISGEASPGAVVNITGGAGATGTTTNSDGGHVFIAGGAPGSGAVPGNVVLARTSAGTSRGAGVQIGPLITGGSATITNVLGAAASLDFPNTVAGTFSDLPITVTGATSNNVAVCLSTPWMCATNGGSYFTYASNDTIYVRFLNHNLVSAIDPVPGTFSVVAFRIR